MDGNRGTSWRDAEIARLLAGYFGEKLRLPHVAHIIGEIATALAVREGEAEQFQAEPVEVQPDSRAQTPAGTDDKEGVGGEGNHCKA